MKKYIDLIKLKDDAIDSLKRPFQNKNAKNQLKVEIAKLESKISELEVNILESKANYPFDLNSILDNIDEKELLERRLEQANELMKELF